MKLKGEFRMSEFNNPRGSMSWKVTGTKVTGERIRRNFQTQAEALGEKQRLELEAANLPPTAILKRTRLTDEQIEQAERAFADLGNRSLADAVRYYLENYREPVNRKPLNGELGALNEFLAAKRKSNKRQETIRNLGARVGRFAKLHPSKLVSDILPEHVSEFVFRDELAPQTQSNNRRALSSFFSWAVSKRYCVGNPVEDTETPTIENGEPFVLSIAEVRRLLESARDYKEGKLLPYIALGIFAAIRPTELARLKWENIDIEQGTITIGAGMAKMRERRIVEMQPNLVEWLTPHATERTPIKDQNWQRDFDGVKEMAGFGSLKRQTKLNKGKPESEHVKLTPWTQDAMRHTGISNHFAYFEHEGKTAAWAGNSPDVVHKHYRGLLRKQDAEHFWNIRPGDADIVELKAA